MLLSTARGKINSAASVRATKPDKKKARAGAIIHRAGEINSAVSEDSIKAKEEINPARMVISAARGKTLHPCGFCLNIPRADELTPARRSGKVAVESSSARG